jgi:hypothetical protein
MSVDGVPKSLGFVGFVIFAYKSVGIFFIQVKSDVSGGLIFLVLILGSRL